MFPLWRKNSAMKIKENFFHIKEKIEKAAKKAGRSPEEISIVAAGKGRSATEIQEAVEAGIKIVGENRVQEAKEKIPLLKDFPIEWHFIGHLQRNKVKQVLELFSLIQSVDSQRLIEEINKRALERKICIPVFIEVNISQEPQKFGLPPEGVIDFIGKNASLSGVKIKGLMTIAPWILPEKTRPYFKKMREIFERAKKEVPRVNLEYLSMGMSDDFWVAIEEGSNMIRVGRALFEGK